MNNQLQEKLNELFKTYSKNLPNKISHIETLWKEQQTNWNLIQFKEFHREVHSLSGSAGTYGYSELSKVARHMEIFLKTILDKELVSNKDRQQISSYLEQLKSAIPSKLPQNITLFESKPLIQTDNKCVYIMEQDKELIQQLDESLRQVDYNLHPIQDLVALQQTIKEQPPIAMIIDTHYLDEISIQLILDLQKELITPIQLFCIVPDAELLPRLKAIRAGCQAFFQKPLDVFHLTQILNYKSSTISDAPYRILIIDDSESLAEYYALILNQAGMTAQAITNPLKLFKEIEAFQPNLLLMDVYMPEYSGFELATVLRQEINYTKIPIIFLSTEEDKDTKLFAISLGGDDFLTKPISPQHLISAVRSRSKRASILNYYMNTDSLTGLLNHTNILKQLDIQLARSQLTNLPLSLIIIDIDHFKEINDNYGHLVGDVVIKKLSTLFLSRLRNQDSVGRYGGEEFILILPSSTLEDSKVIVENLLKQFSQYCFKTEDNQFFVTFSAGISCYDGSNDAAMLIGQADQALYKAKQMGRNQIITWE